MLRKCQGIVCKKTFLLVLNNLQWLSFFVFVAAIKACPVHTSIHSVELWRERAEKQAEVNNISMNKLQLILEKHMCNGQKIRNILV